jgi:hypothetical protein
MGSKGRTREHDRAGWIVPHRNEDIASGSFWNRLEFVGTPEGMQAALEAGTLPNMSPSADQAARTPEDIANLAMFLASTSRLYHGSTDLGERWRLHAVRESGVADGE